MRSLSVAVAVLLTVLSAAGASACFLRASQLKREGRWLLERGNAQAQEYARSFDAEVAKRQMETLEQRRRVLERANMWQRFQMLLIVFTVIGAFCSYVLYLFRRLREQLVEAASSLEELETPPPVPPGTIRVHG